MKKKSIPKISIDNIWDLSMLEKELGINKDLTIRYLIQFYKKHREPKSIKSSVTLVRKRK